ncbi:putative Nucleoside diphosphate-linked moiety X motif 6 [Hypsibius exemplaris]|uniref:Nucleoside diphosphate-linked moiety X motif 6 n=1 Tax=Hypsibius exemplaris TaxID=2072580 RepID=A0A1W0X930_HYPEX|nr:putative Nucleoside diphosphate-linked moiety X motif 6 [Hypsibius exemplaris]
MLARMLFNPRPIHRPLSRILCGHYQKWASTFTVTRMDRYKTVRIEVLGRTASFSAPGRGGETEVFLTELREEIARCREKQAKGIWMTLPLSGFYLAPTCRLEGFTLHHIQDDRLVLSLSLLKDSANTMLKYLSHTVGVAGCVINKKTAQVLVIRDTTRPNIWKLPGGFSEPGENIQQTAQREILEETGIDSEFQSVLAFRQHHKMPSSFGMSDIYVEQAIPVHLSDVFWSQKAGKAILLMDAKCGVKDIFL